MRKHAALILTVLACLIAYVGFSSYASTNKNIKAYLVPDFADCDTVR